MRQVLGAKKHKKCEAVTGRKYTACLTRGGNPHFWAMCWWELEPGQESSKDCDWVNWKTGKWGPVVRAGQFVD